MPEIEYVYTGVCIGGPYDGKQIPDNGGTKLKYVNREKLGVDPTVQLYNKITIHGGNKLFVVLVHEDLTANEIIPKLLEQYAKRDPIR